jgi:hypothetical protein
MAEREPELRHHLLTDAALSAWAHAMKSLACPTSIRVFGTALGIAKARSIADAKQSAPGFVATLSPLGPNYHRRVRPPGRYISQADHRPEAM